jgi:hypothetical protein
MSKHLLCLVTALALAATGAAAAADRATGAPPAALAADLAPLFATASSCAAASALPALNPPVTPEFNLVCGSCGDAICIGKKSGASCGPIAQGLECALQLQACSTGGYHCVCAPP